MGYDYNSNLWSNDDGPFFPDLDFDVLLQEGPHCVSTTLAMITGEEPEYFQSKINTQDPVSWSNALREFGMKLAYCPHDVRRLEFYIDELLELDDLFFLSFYSPTDCSILDDPDHRGWVCGSHIVTLYRSEIYDTAMGEIYDALEYPKIDHYTKRIFRVVPVDHERGL